MTSPFALATIQGTNELAIPAHIANAMQQLGQNVVDRTSVPSLSYKGKQWQVSLGGETTLLTRFDQESGEQVGISLVKFVVLDYAKRRGRAYYPGQYDPQKTTAPLCWSDDGETPHESVEEPQATKCGSCQWAVKGSKVTENGQQVQACSQHRMLAIKPLGTLPDGTEIPVLRFKIAVTSDYDADNKEAEKAGYFAWAQYTRMLQGKGVKHTALLVTKAKMDPAATHPKVIFSADRWLTQEEVDALAPLVHAEETQRLLNGSWTPAGVDGVPAKPQPEAPAKDPYADEEDAPAAPTAPAPKPAAKAPAAPPAAPKAAPKAAPAPKATAAPKATPAPAAVPAINYGDDEEDAPAAPAPAAKATTKAKGAKAAPAAPVTAPVAVTEVPEDVEALLAEWES